MGDSSWLNNELSQPGYNNWVKGNLIFRQLKTGLNPVLDDKARGLQEQVLSNVTASSAVCPVCTEKDLRKGKYVCPSGICTTILQDINKHFIHHPSGTVKLMNTDHQAWCDKNRYWEIAKTYISTPGYDSKMSSAETDCVGLLSIIINCTWIHHSLAVGPTVFIQIKDIRNAMMHSVDYKMASGELDNLFDYCVQVLQESQFAANPTAQDALAKIREIKDKDLTLSGIDLPAVMFIIDAVKAHQQKDSEKIVNLEARSAALVTDSQNLKVWQQLAEERMEKHDKQQQEISQLQFTVTQLQFTVTQLQIDVSQLQTNVSQQLAGQQQTLLQVVDTVSQFNATIQRQHQHAMLQRDTTVSQLGSQVSQHHEEHPQDMSQHDAHISNLEDGKSTETSHMTKGPDNLPNFLLKLYREKILQKKPNASLSMKDVQQMVVPLDIQEDLERRMTLLRTNRKKDTREGTKIKSKQEMFFKCLERQFKIYLLGEAGVGKPTFCHQLIDDWCKVQDTESNDDYLLELKSFPFLFFIQARHAKKSQSVYEMIQTQNCPLKFRSFLEEVFTSHPENCLVLFDGLNECLSGKRGYQDLSNVIEIEGSTILITQDSGELKH